VPNKTKPQKSFWTHTMVLLGYEAQVDARFNPCEIVLMLMQDRCTVCAERTIGPKIVLDAPMELLGDVGHVESQFGPFGDSVRLGARWVHGLCQT
jgi:hypothetical protein